MTNWTKEERRNKWQFRISLPALLRAFRTDFCVGEVPSFLKGLGILQARAMMGVLFGPNSKTPEFSPEGTLNVPRIHTGDFISPGLK